ncbi:MAG: putative secreted glycosyl hydrolase [Verrucomicrobiaceae bacterium]|nr:putative secreted glycosyl hydrolase [Verrucomicrobiaceae bacterium]
MLGVMIPSTLRIAVAALVCLSSASLFATPPPDTTGWKDLFAPDLSDAIAPAKWSFANGELVAGDHETLWTKESYGDFILDLEFKVAKESNSGVFLHSSDIKNVLGALEIQVHESTDGSKYGMVGAIYDAKPPSKNMAKPVGEWNHFTITCKDSLVSVVFNGEEVIHADLNDWPEVKKNPDGTPNKFPVALKDFARKGPLGLQGLHGKAQAPVWYRNLKIKTL